ncbi:type IV pilin N-terminal domain-containing protein [Halobellus ordinarius]|uniref:type IV pilin N-terminal domain-containing protein n=1 Tax=Halobellus ordinarius TaxID=3075120 RepID=UPI0028800E2A|nr:type IV pilin [Halobellus sp. ZY16]
MVRRSRAISYVIATILLVGIVVILAATISTVMFGFTDELREPAPNVAQSDGEFLPQDGNSGGIVKITHVSGDPLTISEIEISVRAECSDGTRRGRIVNLPAGSGNAIRESDGQIEGDNIFDERSLNLIDNNVAGVDNGGALLQGGQFTAGDVILFRIPDSKCSLTQGSEVSVEIVHKPSQAVVVDKELTA